MCRLSIWIIRTAFGSFSYLQTFFPGHSPCCSQRDLLKHKLIISLPNSKQLELFIVQRMKCTPFSAAVRLPLSPEFCLQSSLLSASPYLLPVPMSPVLSASQIISRPPDRWRPLCTVPCVGKPISFARQGALSAGEEHSLQVIWSLVTTR